MKIRKTITLRTSVNIVPPNLPGSIPKKANLILSQTRAETPDLENMNH